MNTDEAKRVLETALICAQQPLPLRDMRSLFDDQVGPDTLRSLLDAIADNKVEEPAPDTKSDDKSMTIIRYGVSTSARPK